MIFKWDAKKSTANKKKHAIDFETAQNLWLDENLIEIHTLYPLENRGIVIGRLKGKLWTAVYTIRDNAIRIISVRRAREKEVKLYEKEKTG